MSTKKQFKSFDEFNQAMARGSFHTAKQLGLLLIQDEEFKSDSLNFTKLLQLLGNASFILSEYPEAISYYNQAISVSTSIHDEEGIAASLGNLGLVHHTLSEYTEALRYLEQAIEINDKKDGNKKYLAYNLGNVGLVFSSLSDKEKALEYFNRAMMINQEIQNTEGLASNHGNIGLLYQEESKYDDALTCFEHALKLYKEINNQKAVATSYGNIGNVYFNKEDIEQSLVFHEKAISIYKEIQNKDGLAISYGAMGEIFLKKKEYEEALKYIQLSHNIASDIGDQVTIMKGLLLISKIHEINKAFELALDTYKMYTDLKDRIQSDHSKRQAYLFDQRRKIQDEEKNKHIQFVRMEEQEKLLHTILPINIVERILNQEQFIADYYPSVSVLFLDIVGFTTLSANIPPKHLIYILDTIFSTADEIIVHHGLEKIKTIGDGNLAVGNLTSSLEQHQLATSSAALEIMDVITNLNIVLPEFGEKSPQELNPQIEIRIGIHSGEVIAGIVGKNRYIFDLWGDSVNITSRMESTSLPGKIHISDTFASYIKHDTKFELIPREPIEIKGKGMMNTFWLEYRNL